MHTVSLRICCNLSFLNCTEKSVLPTIILNFKTIRRHKIQVWTDSLAEAFSSQRYIWTLIQNDSDKI